VLGTQLIERIKRPVCMLWSVFLVTFCQVFLIWAAVSNQDLQIAARAQHFAVEGWCVDKWIHFTYNLDPRADY
jgi:hypothetical protein